MPYDNDFIICPYCGHFIEPTDEIRKLRKTTMNCTELDCDCSFCVNVSYENGRDKFTTMIIDKSSFENE